jgi:hypothetical protein
VVRLRVRITCASWLDERCIPLLLAAPLATAAAPDGTTAAEDRYIFTVPRSTLLHNLS